MGKSDESKGSNLLGKRKFINVTLRVGKRAKKGPIICRAQSGLPANLRQQGDLGKFHLIKCRSQGLKLLVGKDNDSKTLTLGTPISGSNVHALATYNPESEHAEVHFVQEEFDMAQIRENNNKDLLKDKIKLESGEVELRHRDATHAFGSSYGKKKMNAFTRREKNQKATLQADQKASEATE